MHKVLFLIALGLFCSNVEAAFTCEQIKDKPVQASCIEDRNAADTAKEKTADAEKIKAENAPRQKFIDGANSVVKAYRKLQYRIDSGISFKEFQTTLSEVKVEFKMFDNSPDGQFKDPEKYGNFYSGLIMADMDYDNAVALWKTSIFGRLDQSLKAQALSDVKDNFKKAVKEIDKAAACLTQ